MKQTLFLLSAFCFFTKLAAYTYEEEKLAKMLASNCIEFDAKTNTFSLTGKRALSQVAHIGKYQFNYVGANTCTNVGNKPFQISFRVEHTEVHLTIETEDEINNALLCYQEKAYRDDIDLTSRREIRTAKLDPAVNAIKNRLELTEKKLQTLKTQCGASGVYSEEAQSQIDALQGEYERLKTYLADRLAKIHP